MGRRGGWGCSRVVRDGMVKGGVGGIGWVGVVESANLECHLFNLFFSFSLGKSFFSILRNLFF